MGITLLCCITRSYRVALSDEDECLSLMAIKLSPISLLSEYGSSSEGIAGNLREMLLQDSSELYSVETLLKEIAAQLCFELAHGTSSPWHADGYVILRDIYRTPHGRQSLKNTHMIDNLAVSFFPKAAQLNVREHAQGIGFFINFRNGHSSLPPHHTRLLSPGGIPLLVERAKSIDVEHFGNDTFGDIWHMTAAILSVSELDLYAPILVKCDVCPTLVKFLVYMPHSSDENRYFASYQLVRTLRNLAGQRAVLLATTDELKQILLHLGDHVGKFLGDACRVEIEEAIREIWPPVHVPTGIIEGAGNVRSDAAGVLPQLI